MVNIVPKVFPDKPDSYLMIEDRKVSGEFEAPETGWYQIAAVGSGGYGGSGFYSPNNYHAGGGSGGSPGICIKTNIKLNKGEKIPYTIAGNVSISDDVHDIHLTATQGGPGGRATDGPGYPANNGSAGYAGTASGGDTNINGSPGKIGTPGSPAAGGVTTNNLGLSAYGGKGGYAAYPNYNLVPPTSGNAAFIRFYRGNTNMPLDQLNAQNITGLMLEMSQLAQEQTSMLINADVSH